MRWVGQISRHGLCVPLDEHLVQLLRAYEIVERLVAVMYGKRERELPRHASPGPVALSPLRLQFVLKTKRGRYRDPCRQFVMKCSPGPRSITGSAFDGNSGELLGFWIDMPGFDCEAYPPSGSKPFGSRGGLPQFFHLIVGEHGINVGNYKLRVPGGGGVCGSPERCNGLTNLVTPRSRPS
jgi:hypothetical protein